MAVEIVAAVPLMAAAILVISPVVKVPIAITAEEV